MNSLRIKGCHAHTAYTQISYLNARTNWNYYDNVTNNDFACRPNCACEVELAWPRTWQPLRISWSMPFCWPRLLSTSAWDDTRVSKDKKTACAFFRSDLEGIAEVCRSWQDIDLVSVPSRGLQKFCQRNDNITKIEKKKTQFPVCPCYPCCFPRTVELRTFYIVFLNLSLGEPESPARIGLGFPVTVDLHLQESAFRWWSHSLCDVICQHQDFKYLLITAAILRVLKILLLSISENFMDSFPKRLQVEVLSGVPEVPSKRFLRLIRYPLSYLPKVWSYVFGIWSASKVGVDDQWHDLSASSSLRSRNHLHHLKSSNTRLCCFQNLFEFSLKLQ